MTSPSKPYPPQWEQVADLRVFRTTSQEWEKLIGWRADMRKRGWKLLRVSSEGTDLGARIFVGAAIAGPADWIGYPTTFTVDSIVPDSGTPPPLADNLGRARKLVFSGRLVPRGEFVNGVASDSALAQSLAQFLANFRDFMPRLPRDGLTPGIAWTAPLDPTQKGA